MRVLDTHKMVQFSTHAEERLFALDALRGIAALLVLVSHCHSTLPEIWQQQLALYDSPFRLLVLGRPAVILFFVLSGCVLSLSLERRPDSAFSAFVVRRFFRIYVPFAAAIIVSAILYLLIEPRPLAGVSAWFNGDIWSEPVNPSMLLAHLAMIGRPQDVTLNGPMWSLIIELRLSLIFPLLFLLLWPRPWLLLIATLVTAALTEFLGRKTGLGVEPYFNRSPVQFVTFTLYFASFFVLGILVARFRRQLQAWIAGLNLVFVGILWLSSFALLSLAADTPNGMGAALLIVLVLASPGAKASLSRPLPQWLGRVSYSLYLTHVPVLGALVHVLHGSIPLVWTLLAVMILSLVVAQMSYAFVERPSTALGGRLSARLEKGRRLRRTIK